MLCTHHWTLVVFSLLHRCAGNLWPSQYCCGRSELLLRTSLNFHNDLLYTITSGQHSAISTKPPPITPVFRCWKYSVWLCQHLFCSIKHKQRGERGKGCHLRFWFCLINFSITARLRLTSNSASISVGDTWSTVLIIHIRATLYIYAQFAITPNPAIFNSFTLEISPKALLLCINIHPPCTCMNLVERKRSDATQNNML